MTLDVNGFPDDPRPPMTADQTQAVTAEGEALLRPTPTIDRDDWRGVQTAFRMDAYYYGFDPTGLEVIDLILSAVACAGKAFHHTDQWNEDCKAYHEKLRGDTPADWIQNAASDAADAIRAALAAQPADSAMEVLRELVEAIEEVKISSTNLEGRKAWARIDSAIDRARSLTRQGDAA